MPKKKPFMTTLILSVAILISTFLASCTDQSVEVKNASDAREAVLTYLNDQYTDSVPPKGLTFQEHVITPEGMVGAETREFVSANWKVTVSYSVVLPENTIYNVIVFDTEAGWRWKGNVKADGTVVELDAFKQMTKEESQNIALEFVKNSPTFVFDGIGETLQLTDGIEVSIPYTWTFVLHFESANAGYGDRTGRMVAEVITPHEVSITVEQGEIVYASMDNEWDMITQSEQNKDYNAYIVSSELRAVPIIESETNQTVGQAYNGFAIPVSEIRNEQAYFYLNISDPSVPNVTTRKGFYISLNHMRKAFVETQAVPAIISLDLIHIKPMAGISLFREGQQQVIARFNDEVGPIQFIQNVEDGYLFTIGMNLVYVGESDVKLIPYDD